MSTCFLECPACKKVWGKMKFRYESRINASDVTVTAGRKKKFKNGEDLKCSCCGYAYKMSDVFLAIAASEENNGQTKVP